MEKQSFNLSDGFFNGFASIFMNLVYLIIFIYVLILILNFLSEKFVDKESPSPKATITYLLIILNKLFFISGFGFIIGNIFNVILSELTKNHSMPVPGFGRDWDYLTFGIILIFIGIGFNRARKDLVKEKGE